MVYYSIDQLGIINNYPDGDVNFLPRKDIQKDSVISLKHKIKSPTDLYLLIQVANAFPSIKTLYIPYLPGRADRETTSCGFSLKIIADLINLCKFDKVNILRPHSRVTLDLINNSALIDRTPDLLGLLFVIEALKDVTAIIPDKGASSWVKEVFKDTALPEIIMPINFLQMNKVRSGSSVIIELDSGQEEVKASLSNNLVIIDDLIDGGKTFYETAMLLKSMYPEKRIFLIATHGIFSKQYGWFEGIIDRIVCTDSYYYPVHKDITVLKV